MEVFLWCESFDIQDWFFFIFPFSSRLRQLILEQDGLDSLTAAFVDSTSPISVQTEVTAALAVIAGNSKYHFPLGMMGSHLLNSLLIPVMSRLLHFCDLP